MAKVCVGCSKKIGVFDDMVTIKNGEALCMSCAGRIGIRKPCTLGTNAKKVESWLNWTGNRKDMLLEIDKTISATGWDTFRIQLFSETDWALLEKGKKEEALTDSTNPPEDTDHPIPASKLEEKLASVKELYEGTLPGSVFHVVGSRGRILDVFPNKCMITVKVTAGSVLSGNATDGEKTIWFGDCIGLQYKKPVVTLGYLQLETAAPTMNNAKSNFFNENSFTFDEGCITSDEMDVIVEYIKGRLDLIKARQYGFDEE